MQGDEKAMNAQRKLRCCCIVMVHYPVLNLSRTLSDYTLIKHRAVVGSEHQWLDSGTGIEKKPRQKALLQTGDAHSIDWDR